MSKKRGRFCGLLLGIFILMLTFGCAHLGNKESWDYMTNQANSGNLAEKLESFSDGGFEFVGTVYDGQDIIIIARKRK